MANVKMVCDECGSEDVVAGAWATWNVTTQQWEVSTVMDKGHYCNVCDGECGIDEVPL